jgi:hypothetical protein
MLTQVMIPQWVHYKLDETIKQLCSDFHSTHQMLLRTYILQNYFFLSLFSGVLKKMLSYTLVIIRF